MPVSRKPTFTRRRLLSALVIAIAGSAAAVWFCRFAITRWAIDRALTAAGLAPATFQVDAVGTGGLRIINLSVGADPQPWLSIASADISFTLRSLLSARVQLIRLDQVHWTVQSNEGTTDWGYLPQPNPNPAPLSLHLPFDVLDITGSTIHLIKDGTPYDVLFAGRATPAGPGSVTCNLDLQALDRKATLSATLTSTPTELTVDMDGAASSLPLLAPPASTAALPSIPPSTTQAAWHVTISRVHASSATTIDLSCTLDALSELAGDTPITLSHATITARADFRDSALAALTCTLSSQNLQAGPVTLLTSELKATKLDGPAAEINLAATGEGWDLPALHATLRWDSTTDPATTPPAPTTTNFSLAANLLQPAHLNLESAGISGSIESLAASARLQSGNAGLQMLDGALTLADTSLHAGDTSLSDIYASATFRNPEAIEITSLGAVVDDGSIITAQPFTWNPTTKRIGALLSISNLSLSHWLPIVTSKHASGEGRVSGSATIGLNWSTGIMKLEGLKGSLRADPEHGFIQVADADALGDLLDAQDPRFATDELMRPVRDRIISALRDFAFKKLTVELSRIGDRTIALTYVSGFGRHGDDPQGLNLTLDLQAQDSFVDLASRIAARSRLTRSAGSALDEFFQEPPPTQEQPR